MNLICISRRKIKDVTMETSALSVWHSTVKWIHGSNIPEEAVIEAYTLGMTGRLLDALTTLGASAQSYMDRVDQSLKEEHGGK